MVSSAPTLEETLANAVFALGPLGVALLSMLWVLATVITYCWIAVGWHRFVLREEYPAGSFPRWDGGAVWAYIVQSIKIGVVLVAGGLVAAALVALAAAAAPNTFAVTALTALATTFALAWIGLRIGLGLPAVSLGERLGLRSSWRATAALSGPVFVAAVLLTFLGVVGSLAGELPLPLAVPAAFVLDWITLMLGIAILTTLYGHLIEGRDLG